MRAQDFPAYTFIEPAYLPFGQNDQHPPHDVLKGDDLIASVYNAIRARKEIWDSTLFILTWDEHGGFYDHVEPPPAVPPDHNSQEGFGFDRYGVRVPAVLISRWVKPRSVFAPRRGVLDHTSILRYMSDKYDLGPLGNRTASAASIAEAIIGDPNDRSPNKVGAEPRPIAMTAVTDQAPPALNKNQAALVDFTKQLEVDIGAAPADVGVRAMRATSGLEGEIESAKERVRLFLSEDR
jgi:phospholipase C